ncbi:MAG: hypothetical protein RIK87_05365 [Fuerstiella sp.]
MARHGWLLAGIVALLVVVGPLFVCMPVNSDSALFDVQADRLLHGGILYRDIVEPNLPGVVWIHTAVRSLLGWSSEALRTADLLIFGCMLAVFCRLLCSVRQALLFCLAALLFYLSCNEWCHCQRDTWMLLPVAAAVLLRVGRKRQKHVDRADSDLPEPAVRRALLSAVAEGFCWGCAVWIKPHVAVPALTLIVVDLMRRGGRADGTHAHGTHADGIRDAAAVVFGGLLAGLPGILWLVLSDTWPHFLEMMLEWNPEYLQAGRSRQSLDRWVLMFRRFYPWWCVHLVAVPLALRTLKAALTTSSRPSASAAHDDSNAAFGPANSEAFVSIAALYLGWLVQSLALQHAMDYIHVPGILLGLMILASWYRDPAVGPRGALAAAFLLLAVLASPILRVERLKMWPQCVTAGSSTEVRATLAHGNFPQWKDLSQVADFLRRQQVTDGELTCLNVHSVHLFRELDVQPATRYWCVRILQELFPTRAALIEDTVRNSGTRFLVTETRESGIRSGTLPAEYPWNLPVVFVAGSYFVHSVPAAVVDTQSGTAASGTPPRIALQ